MVHNISKAQPVFSIKQSLVYLLIWNQKRIVEHCWANIASWELCAGNYPSECSFLPIITDDTADARGTAQTCQKGKIRRKVTGQRLCYGLYNMSETKQPARGLLDISGQGVCLTRGCSPWYILSKVQKEVLFLRHRGSQKFFERASFKFEMSFSEYLKIPPICNANAVSSPRLCRSTIWFMGFQSENSSKFFSFQINQRLHRFKLSFGAKLPPF